MVSQNVPQVLLAALYGLGPAGQFALATRIVAAPVRILGDSVGQVFYARIGLLHRDGRDICEPIVRSTLLMAALGAAPFAALAAIAPWGFPIVFGSEWRQGGILPREQC